jgi:LysM repeat protein
MTADRTTQQFASKQPAKRFPRWVVVLFLAIVIIAMASVIATAFTIRQNTGTLVVNPATGGTKVSIGQPGGETKIVGTGSTTIRLKPGIYQITAADDAGATSKRIVIAKHATTTLNLTNPPAVPITTIAQYHAKHMYVNGDTLYFLNQKDGIPYTYRLGSDEGRPYLAMLNSVRSMHWLSPTEVMAENNGGRWMHIKDELSKPFAFKDTSPNPGAASFNKDGAMAFVASKRVVSGAKADGEFQEIGDTKSNTTRVSVAPNGNTLVYTPHTTSNDPRETTRLYQNGTFIPLGENLTGISNVQWNTDSTAFSYTSKDGGFVYDLASKTSTHVLASTPTHPNSATWISPTMLAYADNGIIWGYDTGKDVSTKLVDVAGTLQADASLYMTDDGKTIYFSTASDKVGKQGAIYSFMPGYHGMSREEQTAAKDQQPKTQHVKAYVGTETLIDNGLTPDQVQSLKYALSEFMATTDDAMVKVITIKDVRTKLEHDQNYEINFKLLVNNTTYDARLEVTNIAAIQLFVYKERTREQIFDSGLIKSM